jgi:hypothetical protein
MNRTLHIVLILYGMVLICLSIILLFSLTHRHKNVCILTQALEKIRKFQLEIINLHALCVGLTL